MRFALIFFACGSLCFGMTGLWGLKPHTRAKDAPVAVQIEQDGDHLRVLEVARNGGGNSIHQFPASFQPSDAGTEIQILGESWTIRASGKLIIRRGGQTFILLPALEEPLQ